MPHPHELGRVLECYAQVECSELTLHASMARKASTKVFDFKRTDYPEFDPPEYDVFITVSCDDKETGEFFRIGCKNHPDPVKKPPVVD
ncbi:MAG: hypothetical protein IJF78_15850 [Clostridia bacterium]|nr:hypothetical protein [Clostridia bacterium]